jgi:hypothetical protein
MPFPYTQQTWTDGVSSASAARLGVIEAGIALAGVTGTSSTPPGSPVDGMIWRLPAVSASGIYWWFQYDSSQATNKWVFMGGAAMRHEIVTLETTASTAFVDLTTVGPTLTVPRAGDYMLEFGVGGASNNTATDGWSVAPKLGAAATVDADSFVGTNPTGASTVSANGSRKMVKALAASDVVKIQYRALTGGTASFEKRFLFITPVRII